jgi:hypothetical protein
VIVSERKPHHFGPALSESLFHVQHYHHRLVYLCFDGGV